jgi:hypothetical protein
MLSDRDYHASAACHNEPRVRSSRPPGPIERSCELIPQLPKAGNSGLDNFYGGGDLAAAEELDDLPGPYLVPG